MPKFTNDSVVSVSTTTNSPAVQGEGSDNEGVRGISHNEHGGVVGINDWSPASPPGAGGNGGWFESAQGEGVRGWAKTPHHGGVVGTNTAGGIGVFGQSDSNSGVYGESTEGIGVLGESTDNEGVRGISHSAHGGVVGVNDWSPSSPPGAGGNGGWFESTQGEGVRGTAKNPNHGGVVGINTAGGVGVFGQSDITAVWGESKTWVGVYGQSDSTTGGSGVWGEHKGTGAGVVGKSASGVGVWGISSNYEGIHAETQSSSTAAMATYQMNAASGSAAFFAKHMGGKTAGRFEGDVEVTGDIRLTNADCAEDFNIGSDLKVEPGTVMVLGEEGALFPSQRDYDKRVAGVVSGAGNYKPGIVLDKQESKNNRQPIALLGKVYCKVDAQFGAIEVGDLLTTSPTPGHAMKTSDPFKAFGAVIGKALRPLTEGQGLIPILISLQ